MKRLIVLRHAKSSWKDAAIDDHDRPLSPRGKRDAPHMARIIVTHGVEDTLILTSTARRAHDTAVVLANEAGPDATLQDDSRLYLATPGTILAVIAGLDSTAHTIVIVGHNPGLTDLVNLLIPNLALVNIPTAGAVAMRIPIDSWADVGTVAGELEFFEYPKKKRDS